MATKFFKNIEKQFTDLTTINYIHIQFKKKERRNPIKSVWDNKNYDDDVVISSVVVVVDKIVDYLT